MQKKQKTRGGKGHNRKTATKKIALKRKLVTATSKGRSLTAADIKVTERKLRASTSGLMIGRLPVRINDPDRTDSIVWKDSDTSDHAQAINMDTEDVGSHDLSSDSDA